MPVTLRPLPGQGHIVKLANTLIQRTSRAGICHVRPVDPGAHAARRAAGPGPAPLNAHHRPRLGLGGLDPDAFSGDREYVFPAGLATVHIDRDRDTGEYWEPNVWLIHRS